MEDNDMKVKCKCCGKKIDTKAGIRLPVKFSWDENLEGAFYYCSPKCLGNGLTIKCEGAIVDLDLTDEQIDKIVDMVL